MAEKKDTPRPEPGIEVFDIKRPRYDFLVRTSKNILNQMTRRVRSVYKTNIISKIKEESKHQADQDIIIILHSDWLKYDKSERDMNRILFHLARKQDGELILQNRISSQLEKKRIIVFGKMLRQIKKYQKLSSEQIYLSLIFCYYGMNLIEQYWDWLSFGHIKIYFNKDEFKIALDLIFDISAKDIITIDERNLSSEIRRAFMGMDM